MKPDVQAYLNRIGFDGTPKTDFATLCELHTGHLKSIPYENLDIMRDIPLSLEIDDVLEKVISRRRGGYCFELNAIFTWLLRELGFEVVVYMARFLRNETGVPMRRHRVLKVICDDGDYLADVGAGSAVPLIPLPLILGHESRQGDELYKLDREPFFGTVLYRWKHNEWERIYSFTEEEQHDIDFIMPSFYCERHPDSMFRKGDMVHIFTEDGRKSVAGREVKIFSPKGVEVIIPDSEEEYYMLLERYFQIKL